MNLDKVAARLRPRSSWEAVDLGFLLAQQFFKPIAQGWLTCVLPVFVVATLVAATTDLFWLPLVFVWLLKPLYDRVPLLVLSRAFFGEVPGVKATTGMVFRSWRGRAALSDITWRRFSPFRGVTMPVRELENLGGAAASERLGVLLRRQVRGPAIGLTLVAMATEILFLGATLMLIQMVVPSSVQFDLGAKIDTIFSTSVDAPLLEVGAFALYFLVMSAIEIFYAAAGFGLYINRRVRLEGWDIELVFKKLAARLRARARSIFETAAMALLVGLFGLGTFGLPSTASAQTEHAQTEQAASTAPESPQQDEQVRKVTPSEAPEGADPQAEIKDILENPEFGSTRTETTWQLRDELFEQDEDDDENPPDLSFLEQIIKALATTFQIVMWLVAGGLIVAAIVYFYKKTRPLATVEAPEKPLEGPQTELVASEAPAPKVTLPADLIDTAMARWRDGAHAESLSLLYRGTIEGLAKGYRIEIDPSLTAYECVEAVRGAGGPADYVAELARAWTSTVYADRPVSDERAQELFASWKVHFRRGA
jgi:hypothetical protein